MVTAYQITIHEPGTRVRPPVRHEHDAGVQMGCKGWRPNQIHWNGGATISILWECETAPELWEIPYFEPKR